MHRPKVPLHWLSHTHTGHSPARQPGTCSAPPTLPPVFVIFSFTSVVDLVIALQEDGYVAGFMDFYTKEVGGGLQERGGWAWSWPHCACS